ncbi:aldo/keto reductase [Streptomyces sp. NPDC059340]|uniref:aldo/keto reductase n=1 Tax=Streptomyces sp. NPDC059340 TaxID=3346806 RepID=UPI003696C8E1
MPRSCDAPAPFIRSLRCGASTRFWFRDPETAVAGCLRELGVALVAYSPLGRGFLTGTVDVTSLPPGDARKRLPRFRTSANQAIADAIRALEEKTGVAPAQPAPAWVHARREHLGIPVVPVPGTKRVKWLEQDVAAADFGLMADGAVALGGSAAQVTGGRVLSDAGGRGAPVWHDGPRTGPPRERHGDHVVRSRTTADGGRGLHEPEVRRSRARRGRGAHPCRAGG